MILTIEKWLLKIYFLLLKIFNQKNLAVNHLITFIVKSINDGIHMILLKVKCLIKITNVN